MPKVFITGHQGMVGSAVIRAIESHSEWSLLVAGRNQLNLLSLQKTMVEKEEKQKFILHLI